MATRLAHKCHFVLGLPSGSPEIPKVGILVTLRAHNFAWKPLIEMRSKQSCSPRWKFFNGISHATYTQRNQGNSQLLVVGSQINNLTHGVFFAHSLCFKCPNGSCEPILDIYIPWTFQWYKKLLNPMGFDLWNCSMKIQEFIETPTPKVGAHLGVWRFIPSHSPTLLGAWDVTLELPSWPAPLQAFALVMSPRLGLQQSYKAKNEL